MKRRALAMTLGACAGLAGCFLFPTLDEFKDQGGDAASDSESDADVVSNADTGSAPEDGGADVQSALDAASDADAGGVVTVIDSTFDDALDCDGWLLGQGQGTTDLATPGHSGAQSCKMCRVGTTDATSFYKSAKLPGGGGPGSFSVDAWVRTPTDFDASAPAPGWGISLELDDGMGGLFPSNDGNGIDATWQPIHFATSTDHAITGLTLRMFVGSCFLIDDVVVRYKPATP